MHSTDKSLVHLAILSCLSSWYISSYHPSFLRMSVIRVGETSTLERFTHKLGDLIVDGGDGTRDRNSQVEGGNADAAARNHAGPSCVWPPGYVSLTLVHSTHQMNWTNRSSEHRGPIYKISYDLSFDYRKFVVRSTYDSDSKTCWNFSQEYRKLIYEHYLRRYYDFAHESYQWKAFHSLWDVL